MTENTQVKAVNFKTGQKKHQRGRRTMRDVILAEVGTDYLNILETQTPLNAPIAILCDVVYEVTGKTFKPCVPSLKNMLLKDISGKRLTMKNFPNLWSVARRKRGPGKSVEAA
jgi:hypothetical protein